jgi:hypothetical protein
MKSLFLCGWFGFGGDLFFFFFFFWGRGGVFDEVLFHVLRQFLGLARVRGDEMG